MACWKPSAGCNPALTLPSADTKSSHPPMGGPEFPLRGKFGGVAGVGHVGRGCVVRDDT